jgi:hypothetical protein
MKEVIVMQVNLFYKGAIIGLLLIGVSMAGASDKNILESVMAMEQQLGVTLQKSYDLLEDVRRKRIIPDNYNIYHPTVSSDATAIGWWSRKTPYEGEKIPFYWIKSLKEGIQPVWVEGRIPMGSHGISAEGKVIVAMARQSPIRDEPWELLAIDWHSGVVINLTSFVTQVKIDNSLEEISVAGAGNLVALGSVEEKIQVLEIPSGKTIYAGAGRFPRISPDNKRLAFTNKGAIWIYSFEDGSTVQILKGKRVRGIGGWSPDGRFLPAGAWTSPLALDKGQIIVDTTTGKYAVIGKLGEGDFGTYFTWVANKLLD